MLFFQLVNFLSKGFNVIIFLLQLGIVAAGAELKFFHLFLQLTYLFLNLLQFLLGLFINHGRAEKRVSEKRNKKTPMLLGFPRSVPRSGENPAVKKSQHKSPLIFFYAAPPFSGLALPT